MHEFGMCLIVQFCIAFGVAGLLWPEKIKPYFEVMMFPWSASYGTLRLNSIASIALSVLLLARLLVGAR